MRRRHLRGIRAACALAAALTLLLATGAPAAWAHGGRIQPKPPQPGDGGPKPPPPLRPPPPAPKPPPSVPVLPVPRPTTPPPTMPGDTGPGGRPVTPSTKPRPLGQPKVPPTTTPRTPVTEPPTAARPTPRRPTGSDRRRPRAAAATPDATWAMWWDLNRWAWLPDRGRATAGPDGVVTPRADGEPAIDAEALARVRRALVMRQHVVPFLLLQLDPDTPVRPEVRAAALIALGKVTHEEQAVALMVRHLRDGRAAQVVRESAAYALGMLRRGRADEQMDGVRLDAVRADLLAGVDDEDAPVRVRAFAAFALGLLGDQPYGSAFTKDGRVISRALWERALRDYHARDIPVALLTALGMQPAAGTSVEIEEGLQRVVQGRRVGRRRWDAFERSHALSALVEQRGRGWTMTLFRTLTDKRLPTAVHRAALIALGSAAGDLDDDDRLAAGEAVDRAIRMARDGLTRGLGHIALGRLVAADLATEKEVLVTRTGSEALLVGEARHGSHAHRGFSVLALALAARGGAATTPEGARFEADAAATLARGFEREKDPALHGAYVVALGMLGKAAAAHAPALVELVLDRGEDPGVRGHAAVALAQIGAEVEDLRKALRAALWDKRSPTLRREAALALSFLGGAAETSLLVRELRTAESRWILAQVAAALGQLGDLEAVPAVIDLAADTSREDEARALAIASLGLLGDPEAKPSTLRLTVDANYPARTDSLHEAFTLL